MNKEKSIDDLHLGDISAIKLRAWKHLTFRSYASCTGNGNKLEIGVNGKGEYAVIFTENEGVPKRTTHTLAEGAANEYRKIYLSRISNR